MDDGAVYIPVDTQHTRRMHYDGSIQSIHGNRILKPGQCPYSYIPSQLHPQLVIDFPYSPDIKQVDFRTILVVTKTVKEQLFEYNTEFQQTERSKLTEFHIQTITVFYYYMYLVSLLSYFLEVQWNSVRLQMEWQMTSLSFPLKRSQTVLRNSRKIKDSIPMTYRSKPIQQSKF